MCVLWFGPPFAAIWGASLLSFWFVLLLCGLKAGYVELGQHVRLRLVMLVSNINYWCLFNPLKSMHWSNMWYGEYIIIFQKSARCDDFEKEKTCYLTHQRLWGWWFEKAAVYGLKTTPWILTCPFTAAISPCRDSGWEDICCSLWERPCPMITVLSLCGPLGGLYF